jgi:hypothetical protein
MDGGHDRETVYVHFTREKVVSLDTWPMRLKQRRSGEHTITASEEARQRENRKFMGETLKRLVCKSEGRTM